MACNPVAARRRFLGALVAGACALVGADAYAQRSGRMDPEQRERLRRELRQHGEQRDAGRGGGRGRDDREGRRMSAAEREQLRRQLREARPDGGRGGRRRD